MQFDVEDIYRRFNNANCDGLRNKPKFFIIQACRGIEEDEGVAKARIMGDCAMMKPDASPFNSFIDVNPSESSWSDILVLYASIPGYVCYRDEKSGSLLIQFLDYVFRKYAHKLDLRELLDKVVNKIKNLRIPRGLVGVKQVPSIENRGFTNKLYFTKSLSLPTEECKSAESSPGSPPPRRRRHSSETPSRSTNDENERSPTIPALIKKCNVV